MARARKTRKPLPTVITQHPAAQGLNPFGKPFDQLPIRHQAALLDQLFGSSHRRGKTRTIGQTRKARTRVMNQFIDVLHAEDYRLKSLNNVGGKHIEVAVAAWRAQEIQISTLLSRLSMLRWMTSVLGKPGLVRAPHHYGLTDDGAPRDVDAASEVLWSTKGTDPRAKIHEIRQLDPWVASQLELMFQFGLTVREAILLNPAVAHQGDELEVTKGVKRRGARRVAVETVEQTQTLETAKALARTSDRGSMVQPGKTPEQAQRRLYYICAKVGVTRAQLQITPRGLRLERVLADHEAKVQPDPDVDTR